MNTKGNTTISDRSEVAHLNWSYHTTRKNADLCLT